MKNIWIGVDDTDSRTGGCTTYVAQVIIKKLINEGYDIIGYPRLVRLNPNIPWKTRGNGAISLQVGKGTGEETQIGWVNNEEICCKTKKSSSDFLDEDVEKIKGIIESVLDEHAKINDEDTNPGFVILSEQPSFELFDKTVKEIVTLDEIKKILDSSKAHYRGYKNCRGLIGATASVAWSPKHDKTFELISYREKNKWGKDRYVDDDSVKKMDESTKSTFDNYDFENKHNRLVPSSPCPVLFGIRGDDEDELKDACSLIKSEKADSWIVFMTNQGTDDHLQKKVISEIEPFQSVLTYGTVYQKPRTIKGGHVVFSIEDSTGRVDCATYEPTKKFRNIIRDLVVGDIVEVYGGVRENPLTVNIEKINIKSLVNLFEKVENPVCPKCKKHMKSKGTDQGFKCKICGLKSDKPKVVEIKRGIKIGFYEAPVCARRHLSKPLKRMK